MPKRVLRTLPDQGSTIGQPGPDTILSPFEMLLSRGLAINTTPQILSLISQLCSAPRSRPCHIAKDSVRRALDSCELRTSLGEDHSSDKIALEEHVAPARVVTQEVDVGRYAGCLLRQTLRNSSNTGCSHKVQSLVHNAGERRQFSCAASSSILCSNAA